MIRISKDLLLTKADENIKYYLAINKKIINKLINYKYKNKKKKKKTKKKKKKKKNKK